jgi:monoamine oxidase
MTDVDGDHLDVRTAALRTIAVSDDLPPEPADWKGKDAKVSEGPGALIAGYMWGDNALRFGSLGPDAREEAIRACLEQVHPGSGAHVQGVVHRVWGEHESPGGGGFAYFRPTEQRRFGSLMCRPHPDPQHGGQPLVFFAGEHDGIAQGWIQGAIQSSLAAAASVLSQP